MAVIREAGDYWHLIIDEKAKPFENINEPDKGYKATLGEYPETGQHVVMDVYYAKNKYNLEAVKNKVDTLINCEYCKTLDKEKLKVQEINLESSSSSPVISIPSTSQSQELTIPPITLSTQVPTPSRSFQDIFANVFLDTYLTIPGKYFIGMMLNDEKLLGSISPNSEDFMDEMVKFLSGELDFVRSPAEVKDYIAAMRGEEETKTVGAKKVKVRKTGVSQGIVIY